MSLEILFFVVSIICVYFLCFQLLKSDEKNSVQFKDQYDLNRGYPTAEELSADEGYPVVYDNRDDSRLSRRFYRQQIKQ